MKFIDEVVIEVYSGKGGNGCASFRREKFVPMGGPDGGNGGRGAHVFVVADEGMNTLTNFRGKKLYRGRDGENGRGRGADGHAGEDLIIKVPVGTLFTNVETGEIICDLKVHGESIQIAEGGRGGLGNTHFKSSTNQAPRHFQEGDLGKEFHLKLELKLLADIGLVGFPNAGKSTLISSISSARPKVADYPFTTLEPNLGVVSIDDKTVVVADVPGLIEDAAIGKGLGVKFLKHIERTSALVHLVDCSMFIDPFEAIEAYGTIRNELLKFSEKVANKKEIICITKIDAMSEEEINQYQKTLEEHLDKKILPISSVSGRNIEQLKRLMLKTKEK